MRNTLHRVVVATLVVGLLGGVDAHVASPAHAATATLSKASYSDKTLAAIVGSVGGFLSGYEFAASNPNTLPDSWFDPANGPYAGQFTHFTPPGSTADYIRYMGVGRVRGQDNYFMDFFNQRILEEKGINASDEDIRAEYLSYGIRDYGGSGIAHNLMVGAGMKPFQTGRHEFNDVAWCCEPYIETDTLGLITPGMQQTTRSLVDKFAAVSGTFDTTTWSEFNATLMSDAYFTTDARTALAQAGESLPHNAWAYSVYQDAVNLHNTNSDWRVAQGQLVSHRRKLYGADDDRVIADINQGTIMLAILYGNNDYLTTLKIASIGGNEGVDNATPVGELMGIIKGMAGTPQVIKDKIYANGAGVFVNDTSGALHTYVLRNYPASQKWTDLAALYQRNFERVLAANGGTVGSTDYTVLLQSNETPNIVSIPNGDFESGDLTGWTGAPAANVKAETQTGTYGAATYTLSHSGNWKATIFTDAAVHDVSLSRVVSGLTPGATYVARAYVESMSGANADFFVTNGGTLTNSAYSTEDMGSAGQLTKGRAYALRSIEFTAVGTSATIGLRLQSTAAVWANVDDVRIDQLTYPTRTRYEAENATLTGGAGIYNSPSASGGRYAGNLNQVGASATFNTSVSTAGEYRLLLGYSNASGPESYNILLNGDGKTNWPLPASLSLYVNGASQGKVFFPRTGTAGVFSANFIPLPVQLNAGANAITLKRDAGVGIIDLDFGDLGAFPQPVSAAIGSTPPPNLMVNPSFEADGAATQSPANWATWPGAAGTDADADFVETGSHSGTYRLTHYKASAYEVYSSQTVTGLANGTYSATAWVVGGGGQLSAYMDVKGYGAADLQQAIPQSGWPNWTQITIGGVSVTTGTATIGFYSRAAAGNWLSVDDVTFARTG